MTLKPAMRRRRASDAPRDERSYGIAMPNVYGLSVQVPSE